MPASRSAFVEGQVLVLEDRRRVVLRKRLPMTSTARADSHDAVWLTARVTPGKDDEEDLPVLESELPDFSPGCGIPPGQQAGVMALLGATGTPVGRIPVPKVESTLAEVQRVLQAMGEPLDEEQLRHLQYAVHSKAELCRQAIEDHPNDQQVCDNFLSLRAPIPSSTAMTCARLADSGASTQVATAAALLHGIALAKLYWLPQLSHAKQLSEVLGLTRVPGQYVDTLQRNPGSDYVLAICKGRMLKVQVIAGGAPVSKEALQAVLEEAMRVDHAKAPLMCTYSGQPRPQWASQRAVLVGDKAAELHVMEGALCCLCLDSTLPLEEDLLAAVKLGDAANPRYYDMTNLVVFGNGATGLLVDHTLVDGSGMLFMFHMLHHFAGYACAGGGPAPDVAVLDRLCAAGATVPLSAASAERNCLLKVPIQEEWVEDWMELLNDTRLMPTFAAALISAAAHEAMGKRQLVVEPAAMYGFSDGRCDPMYLTSAEGNHLHAWLTAGAGADAAQGFAAIAAFAKWRRQQVSATKQGQHVGPHIGMLRGLMSADATEAHERVAKQLLQKFAVGDVYHSHAPNFGGGCLQSGGCCFSPSMMTVTSCPTAGGLQFNIVSSGAHSDAIPKLVEVLPRFARLLIKPFLCYALACQMDGGASLLTCTESSPLDLVVHGGVASGEGNASGLGPVLLPLAQFCMEYAIKVGVRVQAEGGSLEDVVTATTCALENCSLFNSGKGSVLTETGQSHQLDASVMTSSGACGGVTGVTGMKNPVQAAKALLSDETTALVGNQGPAGCCSLFKNLKTVPNSFFTTAHAKRRFHVKEMETVGCVGRLGRRLVAATSTGGRSGGRVGRISDVAIPNAGVFASKDVAISCSGHGDEILRAMVARSVAHRMEFCFQDVSTACQSTLEELEHPAGVIAITGQGEAVAVATGFFYHATLQDGKVTPCAPAGHSSGSNNFQAKDHVATEEAPKERGLRTGGSQEHQVEVLLHARPWMPGGVRLVAPNGALQQDVFDLPLPAYLTLMAEARQVSSQHLQRCVLVAEPSFDQAPSAVVYPLLGLEANWKPVLHEETAFFSHYPGFVSSLSGPEMDSAELQQVRRSIASAEAEAQLDRLEDVFQGSTEDPGNLFVRLCRGQIPSYRVALDDTSLAFLTPYPNVRGLTVVVPRRHLPSDVLSLTANDFLALATSAYHVAQRIKATLGGKVAMIIEGFEIDYAHIKLVPIPDYCPSIQEAARAAGAPFCHSYQGFLTSLPGPPVGDTPPVCLMNAPMKVPGQPRQHLKFAPASRWCRDIASVCSTLFTAIAGFFQQREFAYAPVPLTCGSVSSPMALGSDSLPVSAYVHGRKTYLADSMQFYLEHTLAVHGQEVPGTWYYNVSFRGEEEDSTHLQQFYHCETEVHGGLDHAMATAEAFLATICQRIVAEHSVDLCERYSSAKHVQRLADKLLAGPLPRVTFRQARELLADKPDAFKLCGGKGGVLTITRAGELELINIFGGCVWLTHFEHLAQPFYQAYALDGTAMAADLLLEGVGEVLGCGERHCNLEDLARALEQHGVPVEGYEWYMDMHAAGRRTSGWGLGTERLLMWVFGHDDIRDMQCVPAHISSRA